MANITKMCKVGKTVKRQNCLRYIKPPLEIYADSESILVPVNNRKRNLDGIYTNKYQDHVAWSFGYKLVCVDDQFCRPFKSYLDQDAVHKVMIEESKLL